MKNLKRTAAVFFCIVLALTCFAGCHSKDETAVTIGKYKFSSGYYACALVFADAEARQKVDDALTKSGKSTEKIDYMKQKVDGKKYEKWVKDKAMENIKINAGYMALCDEKGLKLDPENITTAKNYADQMWTTYGSEKIFGENGVSRETFVEYTIDTYFSTKYFDAVYGKEGSNPVTNEQLQETLNKNYALVYKLETDVSTLSDDEKTAKKTEYEFYADQFKSGVSFEEIYTSVNGEEAATEEGSTEGGVSIDSQEDVEAYNNGTLESDNTAGAPSDKRAELIGNTESDSQSDLYDEVAKMKVGEVKVIEKGTKIAFVVRLDVLSDPYYVDFKDEPLRKLYASDKSNEDAKKKSEAIKIKVNDYAVDQFKVKNIKYPESITIGG